MTRHKRKQIKFKSFYQWHRYIGISIALFVLLLSVTGIALNHTTELELNKSYIKNTRLLDHYGIKAPDSIISYNSNEHWVSQWQKRLYLNKDDLGIIGDTLTGVLNYQGMVVIGLSNSLLLYTPDAELIEKLGNVDGVPLLINGIGITDKQELAVRTENGIFTADSSISVWNKDDVAITVWSDTKALPAKLKHSLLENFRGKGLTLERVLLDLHSGRILKISGVYLMDFVALLLIFLACSGLWIWTIRLIKQQSHKNINKLNKLDNNEH